MASELNITLITAIIGAICGVAGAILGVLNTWHNLRRDRVRLSVRPYHAIPVGLNIAPINFGIEVINLSEFPIVLEDIGFQLLANKRATLSLLTHSIETPSKLPCKLEPHTAYSSRFHTTDVHLDFGHIECAYARTQCGITIRGTSPALKQLTRGSANGK